MTMSQQHTMRGNHSQHLPGGSSRVNAPYLSQQRHSDSRLISLDSGQQMPYVSQRRDSGERLPQQRRRFSADPNLLQHHLENPISPPNTYRHTLAPPPLRGSVGPQDHFHFRHDSTSSAPDEAAYGVEDFGSQVSLTASPARHGSGDRRLPRFDVSSGEEETGCSQPRTWGEPVSHTDIQISISNEGGGHHTMATTQPRPQHHLSLYHAQSQERFVDEEGEEEEGGERLVPSDAILGGTHSTQFPYYDQQLEDPAHYVAPPTTKTDMPSYTSALSQPVVSSRRRFQTSVPDLSLLTVPGGGGAGGGGGNLAHSQFLSQSVLEMPRHALRGGGGDHAGFRPYYDGTHRISRGASQSYHGQLNRMPSDPHLNSEGALVPGLARTMLTRLKAVPEHSPATHRRRLGGASSLQPPKKKGYSNMKKRRSPSPQPQEEFER